MCLLNTRDVIYFQLPVACGSCTSISLVPFACSSLFIHGQCCYYNTTIVFQGPLFLSITHIVCYLVLKILYMWLMGIKSEFLKTRVGCRFIILCLCSSSFRNRYRVDKNYIYFNLISCKSVKSVKYTFALCMRVKQRTG